MIRVLLSFLVCLCGAMPAAQGESLSRSDKLRALYSNQFAFDARGVPLITIGIIEGTDEVTLESSEAITVLPDGEGGAEVSAGSRWIVRLVRSRPAVVEHFVVLASVPVSDLGALREETARWAARGVQARPIEVGAVFGMEGRVFDNRSFLLCAGPFKGEDEATGRAEAYVRARWLGQIRTIAQLAERPSGAIEAVALDGKASVRAPDAIWFAPRRRAGLLGVKSAVNRSGPFTGQLGGRYRGQLYVTIDQRGKLAVVNSLPADQLLDGLVSAEIFPSAPRAALEAQAVAARGNVLAQIGTKNLADPYLTCAWVRCQVYRGAGHEDARTSRAVRATRGVVMMREHGHGLVDAVYHAHCGGHTEDNENVWPGPADRALRGRLDAASGANLSPFGQGISSANLSAWLAKRPDSWCARSGVNENKLRWQVRLDAANPPPGVASLGVGRVLAVTVLERGRSGRAKRVRIRGTHKSAEVRGELNIRRTLGSLPSSMFEVTALPQGFELRGGGWGHGVGMCQSGAIGMARAGKDYRAILRHYYADAQVERIY